MNDRASDRDLLERARRGDQAAFRILVERYEPVVSATVIGITGPGADAEDVAQQTFIRFYAAIGSFRGESSLRTYLTRIAINLSINALRRRRRLWFRHATDGERGLEIPSSGPDPARDLERREIRDAVRAALGRLGPKQRAVVTLRLIDGFSTRETAEILGVPEGTVLSRLSRGLRRMEPLLRPLVDESDG